MKQFIYADNAATTKLDKVAFEAMLPWLTEEYGNASQPYSFARNPKKALSKARETIAACINAQPEEIFFTSGGTESDNWAIKGCALLNLDKKATITSAIEHHAVLLACSSIERMGYPVAHVNPDRTGIVSAETLERIITDDTNLVSIMLANNEIGSIEPIEELAAVAHSHGALFHTDAVQAVGHIPIDVHKLGVDMLSASAHKFNGPKGIGFLYIKKGAKIGALIDGGAQEKGIRAGTENVAAIVGMATALEQNCKDLDENQMHIETLESKVLDGLSGLDFIRNGSQRHLPGNVSLSFRHASGEAILHRLDLNGICISTGAACDSVNTQVSHVIRAIGVPDEYALGTIRISLGKDNTEEEIEHIIDALKNCVNRT